MCIMHLASDIILYRKIFTLLNLYTSILHSYEIIYVLYLISSIMIHISACLTMKLSGLQFKIKVLWGNQKQPQLKKEKGRTDINSTNMTPYGLITHCPIQKCRQRIEIPKNGSRYWFISFSLWIHGNSFDLILTLNSNVNWTNVYFYSLNTISIYVYQRNITVVIQG